MYICDCHCDTLTEAYKSEQSLYQNKCQLDIQRIIENGGGLQFFAIWVPQQYRYFGGAKYTLQIIDKYQREMQLLRKNKVDFINILGKYDIDVALEHKFASLLSIEGGEAIEGSLEVLRVFYNLGVRCMTLTWNYRNDIADGVKESITAGGLTNFGRSVICEMNRLGMLIDVSHISEEGFWDVLELTNKPIIATHSNSKSLCRISRNLSDEQIRAMANNNGVIGVNIYPTFLEENKDEANLDSVYKHIEHIIETAGEDYVAFGTDFDGIDQMPKGINGVQDMLSIVEYLEKKNYPTPVLEKICYRNLFRVLKEVL